MFLNIPKGAGSCLLIITILSRTHTARHFGEHSGRELGILGGERSLEMHAPRLLGCTRRVFWAGTWVLWAGTEGAVRRIVLQIPLRKQGLAIISYEIVYVFKHS